MKPSRAVPSAAVAAMLAGLLAGGPVAVPAAAQRPAVVPASPVPAVGTLAEPKILPLIFEVVALDGSEATRRSGDETTVAFSSDVFFEFGSAALTPAALARLDELVGDLTGVTGPVEVVGHTDSVGSNRVNVPLSRERAEAVAAALRSKLPGITLSVDGRGSSEPVAANSVNGRDNPDGRARNRRVEITYKD